MHHLGCAYYPEYWGVERLETDARLMREAGIGVVRIAEFAWSRMEPEEGRFTLDWLHRTFEVMHAHGIQVLMCTPTATPPAWLVRKYPEMLLQRDDGSRMRHGSRRHYCPTSAVYRRHVERITLKLAEETKRHPNLLGWQIDNELGPESGRCYCDSCQQGFRAWLKQRYGSIEGLNQAWATGFWSEDNFAWEDVRFHIDRPSVAAARGLDMLRFLSQVWIDFAVHQRDLIRRVQPKALVTTNGMGMPIYTEMDHWRLFGDELDVACDDAYFDIAPMANGAAAHDMFRSYKPGKGHWITETGSGALDHGKPPTAAQFRAWLWCGIAHGADAWMIFRWRTCLSGQEQELQGILEHCGHPGKRFQAVKSAFQEVRALMPRLQALPQPAAPVAILHDCDSHWLYQAARVGWDVDADPMPVYRQLWSRGVGVRFQRPGVAIPADVRLLILRNQPLADARQAEALAAYVRAGGTVLVIGQLAMRDANATYLAESSPGCLRELAGASCVGGMYLTGGAGPDSGIFGGPWPKEQTPVAVRGRLGGKPLAGKAERWIGDLQADTATVLATFADEAYAGQPALTEQITGKGRFLWLAAATCEDALLAQVVAYALATAKVEAHAVLPRNVEIQRRGDWLFAINHGTKPVTIDLGAAGTPVLGKITGKRASIPAYGVVVVDTAAKAKRAKR
jgi:beta-galactosidase